MEKPNVPIPSSSDLRSNSNTFIYYCRFRDENGDYMSPSRLFNSPKPRLATGPTKNLKKERLFFLASKE